MSDDYAIETPSLTAVRTMCGCNRFCSSTSSGVKRIGSESGSRP